MNPRCQNKKTPALADINEEERTCIGISMYIADDVPHPQHVMRHEAHRKESEGVAPFGGLSGLTQRCFCVSDMGRTDKWHFPWLSEHRKFRERLGGLHGLRLGI